MSDDIVEQRESCTGLGHLTPEDSIFRDEDVIHDDDEYQPNELVARDDELNEYLQKFKPVIKGKRPRNIFLYGKTGVGKTVATERVLDRVKEDAAQYDYVDVVTVHLKCRNHKTSYQVAANLVNAFRDKFYPDKDRFPTTGVPTGDVYNELYNHIINVPGTHCIIVLDEIDSVGNDDDILYNLPRCNTNGQVPTTDTKVGVIGISNSFTFVDNLSARVQDTLCDEEILFTPYDSNQLQEILNQRAAEAFVGVEIDANGTITEQGVLSNDVIPLVAAFAAQESGSARDALDLLYKAGDTARKHDADQVLEKHVRTAEAKIQEGHIEDELRSLPRQTKIVLYTVLQLQQHGYAPIRSKDLHEVYTRAAEYVDINDLSLRSMRRRVSDLVVRDFLVYDENNKGPDGGSYRKYAIGDIEDDLIRTALYEDKHGNDDSKIELLADIDFQKMIQKILD